MKWTEVNLGEWMSFGRLWAATVGISQAGDWRTFHRRCFLDSLQVHFTFLSINNIKCQVGTPLFFLLYHLVKSFPSYPESQGVSCSFAMLSGFIQGRLHKVQLLSYTSAFVHSQIYLQYLRQSHSMHEYAPYLYAQVHAHPAWLSSMYCTCCTYVYSKYLVSSK